MKGIHSVFTSPYRWHVYNVDREPPMVELYMWVYSILTWKKFGNEIYLYCDNNIYEFVKKYGFDDLYDEIRIREYDDSHHQCFWSYKKILPLEEFNEPVCLFDIDTFFRNTDFTKIHGDLVCYHLESFKNYPEVLKLYNENDLFRQLSFFEEVSEEDRMVNACVVVFNSYDLKQEFLENVKETVNTIREIVSYNDEDYNSYTIFMEQINLTLLYKKYHCTSITEDWVLSECPRWVEDNKYVHNLTGEEWTDNDFKQFYRKMYGNFLFNSTEPICHFGVKKNGMNYGYDIRREFYTEILKEKIIQEGLSPFSKLFLLTGNEEGQHYHSLNDGIGKPLNGPKKDRINKEKFSNWYENTKDLLLDDRFKVALWGSKYGGDIDLIISKQKNVTITELRRHMTELIKSGDKYNITVDVLYTSDIEYFRIFRTEDPNYVLNDVLVGFVNDGNYESYGKMRTIDGVTFIYGPFDTAYYKSTDVSHNIEFVDEIKNLKNNVVAQLSPRIYNMIYERFGIFEYVN